MLMYSWFYALPKERLANLLSRPTTLDVYGNLLVGLDGGQARLTLSDYVLPESMGVRRGPAIYVGIGTLVQANAANPAALRAVRARLDRVAREYRI